MCQNMGQLNVILLLNKKIFFIHFKFIKLFYNVFKLKEIATEIKYRKGDEIK